MRLSSQLPGSSLRPSLVLGSWALYDFANSSFTTLVVTFIYATFFTQVIAADPVSGTTAWSLAISFSGIAIALLSPWLGAVADQGGHRRLLLRTTTLLCILFTCLLYLPVPGQVVLALGLFVLANVCYELTYVFYNSYLPDLSRRETIGKVSGLGWSCGYFGGLACLGLALAGFVGPDQPWFGFSQEDGAHIRATNFLTAAWFLIFAAPFLLFAPRIPAQPGPASNGRTFYNAFRRLAQTFREIRRYRQILRLLIARLFYNDGLITIFAFGGIYAAGTFGFTTSDIIIFGIGLNIAAGLGSILFGFLDDRIGGKNTILCSVVGLLAGTLIAVFAQDRLWFWIGAILIGMMAGPNQAASRSLLGRFVPTAKETEFFGFFAFSGKFTAFLGPLLLGLLTHWTGSQRVGVSVVVLLFLLGGAFLLWVDEDEGSKLPEKQPQANLP